MGSVRGRIVKSATVVGVDFCFFDFGSCSGAIAADGGELVVVSSG